MHGKILYDCDDVQMNEKSGKNYVYPPYVGRAQALKILSNGYECNKQV